LEDLVSGPPEDAAPAPEKPGLLGRLLGRDESRRVLDDAMLESLEELLIRSDMGVDTALRVTANIAEGRFGKRISAADLKDALAAEIARIMEPVARPLPIYAQKPQVVLVVGVNGSGKTTTIGKLASQFKAAGKTVVIAAGDTFRAAAVDQLTIWSERAGVAIVKKEMGSDPASVAFDTVNSAVAKDVDIVIIDTAGRLHNKAHLMEELSKIKRVIQKVIPDAPHETLLVLDGTTGQNAIEQARHFSAATDVSALAITKLDGTAKGGIVLAIANQFKIPVKFIGVGEQASDLIVFDKKAFVEGLFKL
jgi:fused signal recognition particle receptor